MSSILRYYKTVSVNTNKNKDKSIEGDKSLSESDKDDLSSKTSTEEEVNEDSSILTSQKKKKTLRILKKKAKIKVNKKGFQKKWLKEFSWLRYNSEEKKMHCELCRFHNINIPFAKEGRLFYHYWRINFLII